MTTMMASRDSGSLVEATPEQLLAERMRSLRWHDRTVLWTPTEARKADIGVNADGYELVGYAAVFDQVARITDWLGEYDESIRRGAFAKTLTELKREDQAPKVQMDHGHSGLYGDSQIAVHRVATEDAYGLLVGAPLLREHPHVEYTREMIREGAITGMSFRFEVLQEQWRHAESDDEVDVRTITEVRLHEYGPVMHPAYVGTEIGLRAASHLSPEARAKLGYTTEEAQPSSSTTDATSFLN